MSRRFSSAACSLLFAVCIASISPFSVYALSDSGSIPISSEVSSSAVDETSSQEAASSTAMLASSASSEPAASDSVVSSVQLSDSCASDAASQLIVLSLPSDANERWEKELSQRNALAQTAVTVQSYSARNGVYYSANLNDSNWQVIVSALHTAVLAHQNSVDVSTLNIDASNMMNSLSVLYGNLQCMTGGYMLRDLSLQYNTYTQGVVSFSLEYYSDADISAMRAEINSIESEVPAGASALETALIVHDRLVSQTAYNTQGYKLGTLTSEDHCQYNILLHHTGVCDGYAKTYACILNELGVYATESTSNTLSHAWSLIKIDNVWYNVDCTFDDSVFFGLVSGGMSDAVGNCNHANFMISSTALYNNNHVATDFSAFDTNPNVNIAYAATSTTYDAMWWRSISSPISYYNTDWYYLSSAALCNRDTLLSAEASSFSISGSSRASSYSYALLQNRVFLSSASPSRNSSEIVSFNINAASHTIQFSTTYSIVNYGIVSYNGTVYYASANNLYSQTVNRLDFSAEVTAFITRLYRTCLGREPDANGLAYWIAQYNTGNLTASEVAAGFVFSNEFKAKNYCNSCYIKQLYLAFLNREYDANGLSYWMREMGGGMNREGVFNGFIVSAEFTKLCAGYGLEVGTGIQVPEYGTISQGSCNSCGVEDGVTAFVKRMYTAGLSRTPTADEVSYWTERIWAHQSSATNIAADFLFGTEFKAKNYCNSCYIKQLYLALLGRAATTDEMNYWVSQIKNGTSREAVCNAFLSSAQFTAFCRENEIVTGPGLTTVGRGTMQTGPCGNDGTMDGITGFIASLYQSCLGRQYDANGLAYWVNLYAQKGYTASQIAYGFVFSNEFQSRNYCNSCYVKQLYQVFLGRAYDDNGLSYWTNLMDRGYTGGMVFNGFIVSNEFASICAGYGIENGGAVVLPAQEYIPSGICSVCGVQT